MSEVEDLGSYLVETRRMINRLEMDFARAAARFAAAADPMELTSEDNPVQWLREACRMTSHAARTAISVGESEAELTGSIAALEEGSIGIAHLGWMADTAQRLAGTPSAAGFDEKRLLTKAKKLSVQRFRRECQSLIHSADHAGFVADEARGVEARRLRMTMFDDGGMHLEAFLDPEGSAIVRAAIDPFSMRDGADDYRDLRQRRADALVEICGHVLDLGVASQRGGARPHLHVTTTLETLLDVAGASAATVESGALISGPATERLACDSTLIRVLLDTESKLIDVGRAARVVPPATRRALNIRDGGCAWPGCERTASWTQAHHLIHWSVGGPTDLTNLVLLCRRHHWRVHDGGWVIGRADDGEILVLAPAFDAELYGRDPMVLSG